MNENSLTPKLNSTYKSCILLTFFISVKSFATDELFILLFRMVLSLTGVWDIFPFFFAIVSLFAFG